MKYGAWMLMRMPCCFAAAPIFSAVSSPQRTPRPH